MTPDEALEAVEFIRERQMVRHRNVPRCWGISSDALALYAIGGPEPREWDYPFDGDDLAACERTYLMAPPRLQQRMLPILNLYRADLVAKGRL